MNLTPQEQASIAGILGGSIMGFINKKKEKDMPYLDDEQRTKSLLISALKGGLMGGGVGFTAGMFMNNK